MSYGKIVYDGVLEAEIINIRLHGGQIHFTAETKPLKRKQMIDPGKIIHTEWYGEDGVLVTSAKMKADMFKMLGVGVGATIYQPLDITCINFP